MNQQYLELFQMVARNGALNAEKSIETLQKDHEKNHEKEIEVMIEMRDSFNQIEDKLLNGETPDKLEFVKLYAAALVSRNLIQKNITTWTAMVKEYDENLIPKLFEVSSSKTDEQFNSFVKEYFS
jgi:hypothetical protein